MLDTFLAIPAAFVATVAEAASINLSEGSYYTPEAFAVSVAASSSSITNTIDQPYTSNMPSGTHILLGAWAHGEPEPSQPNMHQT